MIRLLDDKDPDLVRPTRSKDKESFRPQMTCSLEDAVLWFLATCAIRRLRGDADQHMTMLVHSSQFVRQHNYMSDLIRDWIKANQSELLRGSGDISRRFDELYEYERGRTASASSDGVPELLSDVRNTLPNVLDALEFPVENGESERRMDYECGPKTYIVVGGTVLARGLTLEGLSVSFFLRTSKQYDTLLQMGRWFGYRPGYDDLPRLWTTSDLAAKFRALSVIEEEIREDIATYRERNHTPMHFAVRVRSIPGMAITSATKMKHAYRTSMSYDGQHVQTIRFAHRDTDVLRGNWISASNLVDAALEAERREDQGRRILFEGVPFEAVRRFVNSTSISEEHMNLRKEHLISYLDQASSSLGPWNVGVIQPTGDTVSARDLGGLGTGPDSPAREAEGGLHALR